MILYHGSNMIVEQPDIKKSKPNKDFGQGFYLSAERGQALRMAEQKVQQTFIGKPTLNRFFFDEKNMQNPNLKVKIFEDYSIEWVEFILMNRDKNNTMPMHDYDIVYGPIADDGVTFQLRRYMAGGITIEELLKELKYPEHITFQYFFGTERALQLLKKL